jgi:hypothetical protein
MVVLLSLGEVLPAQPRADSAAEPLVASSPGAAARAAFPRAVDLRPEFQKWELRPRQQGDRPTCSAFTVAGALEFAVARRQRQGARLSVEFLNWAANQDGGEPKDGGFFSDLWRGFSRYGICREEELPYRSRFDPGESPPPAALAEAKQRLALGLRFHWIKEWDVKTGLTDDHLQGIRKVLAAGWPVCGGFRWPKQEQWIDDVLQWCPADAVRDGHSVLLVGYRDDPAQPGGGVFLFRNTSRDGRDGLMSYAYAQAYMNDAAWVDSAGP